MLFSEIFVLMLPLDVANKNDDCDVPMVELWMIMIIVMAFLAIIAVPWSIHYYEDLDRKRPARIRRATIFTLIALIVFVILYVILWILLGRATVKAETITSIKETDMTISSWDNVDVSSLDASFPSYSV